MPKISTILLSLLFLAIFTSSANALAGDSLTADRDLTILRGSWRFVDFHETSVLNFVADSKMNFDNEPYNYSMGIGLIRVYHDGDSTDYTYKLDGNNLTWNFPDGNKKTFKKFRSGIAESMLKGDYTVYLDTSGTTGLIAFDGAGRVRTVLGPDPELDGLYRVEGDMVYFSFSDGTLDEAEIRTFDSDGMVNSVLYAGNLFEIELPPTTNTSVVYVPNPPYPPGPEPSPPPPPPPGPPYPPPPPPPPPAYENPPGSGNDDKGKKEPAQTNTKRDIGTTRGTDSPRH